MWTTLSRRAGVQTVHSGAHLLHSIPRRAGARKRRVPFVFSGYPAKRSSLLVITS